MRLKVILAVVLAAFVVAAGSALAAFPKPSYYQYYTMAQGWHADQLAWFISLDANSIRMATSGFMPQLWSPWFLVSMELAPKLNQAISPLGVPQAAQPLFIVINYQQGPVFSTAPGQDDYSALWQVFLVTFAPGLARPVTNASPASDMNPQGVPVPPEGKVTTTDIVLDCSMVALGPIGGPVHPAPEGTYRIPQALDWDIQSVTKSVLLPHYLVYTCDRLTGRPTLAHLLVSDAETEEIADAFGANLAPGLTRMPDEGTGDLWVMNGICPPSQFPLVDSAPSGTRPNSNFGYSPIARLEMLDRGIPPYVAVTTPRLLHALLNSGLLTVASGSGRRVNAHAGWVD